MEKVWRRNWKDGTRRAVAERHMTGCLWRLMTSACQSSSHRENRALPSAPKLMGRRQGGEVWCVDPAQRDRREKGRWVDVGLCAKEGRVEVDGEDQGGDQGQRFNEMERWGDDLMEVEKSWWWIRWICNPVEQGGRRCPIPITCCGSCYCALNVLLQFIDSTMKSQWTNW